MVGKLRELAGPSNTKQISFSFESEAYFFAGLEGPREARLDYYCFKCVAFESDAYLSCRNFSGLCQSSWLHDL